MNNSNQKNEKFYKNLAIRLGMIRKHRGYSQIQLAEMANISRVHLSCIESLNVKTSISIDTLIALAEALEIEPYQLLQFDKNDILDL